MFVAAPLGSAAASPSRKRSALWLLLLLGPVLTLPWTWSALIGLWPGEPTPTPSLTGSGQAYDYLHLLADLRENRGHITPERYGRAGLHQPALLGGAVHVALHHLDPGHSNATFLEFCAEPERDPDGEVTLQIVEFARLPTTSSQTRMQILALYYGRDRMQLDSKLAPPAKDAVHRLAQDAGLDLECQSSSVWTDFRHEDLAPLERLRVTWSLLWLDQGKQGQESALRLPVKLRQALILRLLRSRRLTPGQGAWLRSLVNPEMRSLTASRLPVLDLLALAVRYPDSRFTQGCREYGRLRGGTYFGAPWEKRQWRSREARDWAAWLERYPDHPGADDAVYWQARSLEVSGERLRALEILAEQIVAPKGDGDMVDDARRRFLMLLDVGTSTGELERFNARHPLQPLVRYAAAVRLARRHRYQAALNRSQGLDLSHVLNRYLGNEFYDLSGQIAEQRARWSRLGAVSSNWQLARSWAAEDGWRNGYLHLYRGHRAGFFGWRRVALDLPGCSPREDHALLRRNFQLANHNAVALELVEKVLACPRTPRQIQERACFLRLALLDFQHRSYPGPETAAMHPLPGLNQEVTRDVEAGRYDLTEDLPGWQDEPTYGDRVQRWYKEQGIWAAGELLRRFPESRYGDDALLTLWDLTGDESYAAEARRRFPHGDLIRE